MNRTPPNYPVLREPRGPILGDPTALPMQTVTITISPGDDLASLKAKLSAAGAPAPDDFVFRGSAVKGTLGDCGLEAEATITATVAHPNAK